MNRRLPPISQLPPPISQLPPPISQLPPPISQLPPPIQVLQGEEEMLSPEEIEAELAELEESRQKFMSILESATGDERYATLVDLEEINKEIEALKAMRQNHPYQSYQQQGQIPEPPLRVENIEDKLDEDQQYRALLVDALKNFSGSERQATLREIESVDNEIRNLKEILISRRRDIRQYEYMFPEYPISR